jgi:hypothetical protein
MVVVIMYKTKATACRALTFIVRIFVDYAIAIAVWTSFSFHLSASHLRNRGHRTSGILAAASLEASAFAENQILFHDFCDAKITQMFCCLLNRILRSIFPTHDAGADEFNNIIYALGANSFLCHGDFLL